MLLIVTAAIIVRALVVWRFDATVAGDSYRYRRPEDLWFPFKVWRSAGPGVFVQALFLLPAKWGLVGQVVVSGGLFGAVGLHLASVATGRGKWAWFLLTVLWSLSPWVTLWDTWFLTEAVTVPGCVAAAVGAATFAIGGEGHTRGAVLLAAVGAACAILTRPFVLVLLLPLLVWAFVVRSGWRDRRSVVVWCGVAIVALSAFGTWQVVEFEHLSKARNMALTRAADRFGKRGGNPGYLAAAKANGMPPCPVVEATVADTFIHRLKIVRAANCPGFQAWLGNGGLSWQAELSSFPTVTLRDFADPEYWTNTPVRQYLPADARWRAIGTRVPPARTVSWVWLVNVGMFGVSALSLVIAGCLALVRLQRRLRAFLPVAVGWTLMFVFLTWADDGLEYWRHVLPGLMVFGPLGWAVLAMSLRRRPGGDPLPQGAVDDRRAATAEILT